MNPRGASTAAGQLQEAYERLWTQWSEKIESSSLSSVAIRGMKLSAAFFAILEEELRRSLPLFSDD